MLLPAFQDLIKPQWREVLEELKQSGGLPVSELSRRCGHSYMGTKGHCEALTKAGYLVRTRLPRAGVGRPEILYSLAEKADTLFPQASMPFVLGLLEDMKRIFGESAPEKLLFQHLQHQQDRWKPILDPIGDAGKKVARLVALRNAEGGVAGLTNEPGKPPGWKETHHPLHAIFQHYPRIALIEHRMLEELLGHKLGRKEQVGRREAPPTVVFQLES